ncbi:hypothetical protein N9594_00910 [bacterium]|nr:hypothetical protein [bacterium]
MNQITLELRPEGAPEKSGFCSRKGIGDGEGRRVEATQSRQLLGICF